MTATTRPQGHELDVPRAELVRVVARILARCTRQPNGCLLFPLAVEFGIQVRARRADGRLVLLTATRAVLAAFARPAPLGEVVMHTCANARCLAPSHLEARPRSEPTPAAREGVRAANRARRIWSDEEIADLRRLVAGGMKISAAALAMKMPKSTARAIVAGRRMGDRTEPEYGTAKEPRCSRCGELGHYRNRGCPLAKGNEVHP